MDIVPARVHTIVFRCEFPPRLFFDIQGVNIGSKQEIISVVDSVFGHQAQQKRTVQRDALHF